MEAKKTGCSSNKTILVDPNTFDGQSSFSNISVPLEDLSISVQLSTSVKARTVLTSSGNGKKSTSESTNAISVRFIEGSDISGKKFLTTKYTDLTTTFDGGGNSESLGITNIDIDFNSSYAPLITINFVDLRGGAIFQNEAEISGGSNKFSSFFKLPYPMYTLTVKGYYGLPVTYELHMTKFTAKFNSQTGNFEITGSFIGYTYAMLSDMLLGYLKAIPYTKLGAIKYDKMIETNPGLLTLDELMKAISQVDVEAEKLKSTDKGVAQLKQGEKKLEELDLISGPILTLGQQIDIGFDSTKNSDKTEYQYIIENPTKTSDEIKKANDEYTTSIKKVITDFNVDNEITIDEVDFTTNLRPVYKGLTPIMLAKFTTDSVDEKEKVKKLIEIFGKPTLTQEEFDNTRAQLLALANAYGIAADTSFIVHDFRAQYKIISDTRKQLTEEMTNLQQSVGDTLKLKIKEILKLDPTVRNIVEIFTASVEAFMSVLFEVSSSAIGVNKSVREIQLKKYGPSDDPTKPMSYDIKKESLSPSDKNLASVYFPWPEYRVDGADGLVEKYLGELGVLDIPKDVDELAFIDDLLLAFLESKKQTDAVLANTVGETTNWVPVNPIDTRIFIPDFPYSRIVGDTKEDVINTIINRAFIYMGISNYKLTPDEIKAMGEAEANAVLTDVPNKLIIDMLSQLKDSDFYTSKAKNDGNDLVMMKSLPKLGVESWYYNFIFGIPSPFTGYNTSKIDDAKGKHVLPLTTNNGKFEFNFTNYPDNTIKESLLGNIFLTNYDTSAYRNYSPSEHFLTKPFDGGVYVKIISPSDFKSNAKQIPTITATPSVLDLTVFSKTQEDFNADSTGAGFSQFGGSHGIQEYMTLNYGVPINVEGNETTGPFRLMFYQNSNVDTGFKVKSSTFCKPRADGLVGKYDIGAALIQCGQFSIIDSAFDNVLEWVTGDKAVHSNLGDNRQILNSFLNKGVASFPYISFQVNQDINDGLRNSDDSVPVGLFASRLYYEQKTDYAKAFLFLHTLPWNGFFKNTEEGELDGVFSTNEIINTFGNRAGFISAPKLWVAFIGGLLWRASLSAATYYEGTIIQNGGGAGPNDPILWDDGVDSFIPTFPGPVSVGPMTGLIGYTTTPHREAYLTYMWNPRMQPAPMLFSKFMLSIIPIPNNYKPIEEILLQLPEQAKDEFKKVFFDFVDKNDGNSSDWKLLKSKLELISAPVNATGAAWKAAWDKTLTLASLGSGGGLTFINGSDRYALLTSVVKSQYNAIDDSKPVLNNYIVLTPYVDEPSFDYNYFTELKDNSTAVNDLLNLLGEETIIVNTNINIWQVDDIEINTQDSSIRGGIYVSKDDMKIYIDSVLAKLKPSDDQKSAEKEKKKSDLIEIFGTDNDNLIKFQLYRTCKNIYDKWVAGSESGDKVIFKNGNEGRNGIDKHLAKLAADKSGTPSRENELRLIDSFRFVDRSFKDIGDLLYVNPIPVNNYLTTNPNASFYDCVTDLLSSNNFDFIPLPNYINYGDPEELEMMFKPVPTVESFKKGNTGPSFVCVYVGQTSKSLDFNDSTYPNDGVTFKCDQNGNLMHTPAKDFTNIDNKPYENKVAVFAVNYGQQNQNIFKDITLDQGEFSETAESLQIIDDIANKGAENKTTLGGQNMYNVYSVRSYKTEVEMMGNAMIQPMMYFQLNNIPMFHGAYMITHVKHSIKPNYMSTHFTGVRIRSVLTPLLKASDLFMSLINSIDAGSTAESNKAFGGGDGKDGFIGQYRYDLIANITSGIVIEGSLIPSPTELTKRAEAEIASWQSGKLKEENGLTMLDKYAKETPGPSGEQFSNNTHPWSAAFISYVMVSGDPKFPKSPLHYNYITAAMNGVEGYEAFPLSASLKIKAEVGDLFCFKRTGGSMASHCDVVYKTNTTNAFTVGGNVGDSVKLKEIVLDGGYITDATNVSNYKILLKKTGQKYYGGKKIIGTGNYPEVAGNIDPKTGCPAISRGKPMVPIAKSFKLQIENLFAGKDCGKGRDCSGSLAGLKSIPALYSGGKLTKRGVLAMSQGLTEGFGSAPQRKNPGNIRDGSGYATYTTWTDGWNAYNTQFLDRWISGNVTPTASAKYPDCHKEVTNKLFTDSNIVFAPVGSSYNYPKGYSPTLRQFINIYAPWGDDNNPSNYIGGVAMTLKDYGYSISVDDEMKNWLV